VPAHEIDAIRALLGSKPRPVDGRSGAHGRRVGSTWPPASDVRVTPSMATALPGRVVARAGSDPSRVILYFHGGGYCSGSILSHRRMVTEPAARRGRGTAWRSITVARPNTPTRLP